jgi:hypothetical protein
MRARAAASAAARRHMRAVLSEAPSHSTAAKQNNSPLPTQQSQSLM